MRRCVDVHLLNIMDGSPYYAPPSNVIRWSFPMLVGGVSIGRLVMTSSRLMMCISLWETSYDGEVVGRILVWDWRTGDLVRVSRLEWSFFTHLSSGTRNLIHRWEKIGRARYEGHFPR